MARGPSKKVREAYALGQKNKEVHLRGGDDVINPYPDKPRRLGVRGRGRQTAMCRNGIVTRGGPQPDWWDPNPIVEAGDQGGGG